MSSYYFSRILDAPFAQAEERVVEALKAEGFGVLTEIDVQATLRKKLETEFRPYKIFGACNPQMAHRALLAEDKIGVMLPCNVILQEVGDGRTEVAAIDPEVSMQTVGNEQLNGIAAEVGRRLRMVVEAL
ncbi:MAG: DUF302 domain-containing protein [Opitutales bacterium]